MTRMVKEETQEGMREEKRGQEAGRGGQGGGERLKE